MPGDTGRAAFQHRNFRLYMTARFLSVVASESQSLAVTWQIFAITHRPLDLGLVGLAQFMPGLLLFLVAGHAADRFPRKRILQFCYCAFACCSAALAVFSGTGSVMPLYAVLLANGFIRAFNAPAGQAFLPLLVPQEHFPNAVAWGASIFMAATIVGPMVGGLVYGLSEAALAAYITAGVFYLLAVALLSQVQPREGQTRRGVSSETILEGIRYIWNSKLVLGAISLDLFAVLFGGAVALLPVYASDILHVGPRGLGILRASPGAGAILIAMAVAYRPLRGRAGPAMLLGAGGFGVCTVLFGLSRSLPLSVVALFVLGACDMVSVIVRSTLVQLETPDHMRGRVSAVNMLFVGASNEVGQFESGLTAAWFGTVPAVVFGGVAAVGIVGLWSWLFPALREANTETEPAASAIPK